MEIIITLTQSEIWDLLRGRDKEEFKQELRRRFSEVYGGLRDLSFGRPTVKFMYKSRGGGLYQIEIFNSDELIVWTPDGCTSVGSYNLFGPPGPALRQLEDDLYIIDQGKLICSDSECRKPIERNTYRRVFAGVYCENCWESKYKEKQREMYKMLD